MVRGRSPLTMEVCGDSIPNLCKDAWPTVRAQIEKCSHVAFRVTFIIGHPARKKQVCVMSCRRNPATSVELCETEVCFLHIQLIDTNV